jgi:hypothetical protein
MVITATSFTVIVTKDTFSDGDFTVGSCWTDFLTNGFVKEEWFETGITVFVSG